MTQINTYHKNRLQEFCQSHNLAPPVYQLKKQSGPPHICKFQVKVHVNDQWYLGRDYCSSKKEAEQSAAAIALENLVGDQRQSKSNRTFRKTRKHQQALPVLSIKREQIEHFPAKYADIEQFIVDKVKEFNGRIESIWTADIRGRYRVEIAGSYRYCKNVRRYHKNDQIYFLVNPVKRIYYQKCHHRRCFGFRSSMKRIPIE